MSNILFGKCSIECSELLFSLFAASADTHTKSNYKSVKVKSEFKDVTSLQTASRKICISHTVSNPSTPKGCCTTDVDTTFSIGGDCVKQQTNTTDLVSSPTNELVTHNGGNSKVDIHSKTSGILTNT